MTEYPPPVAALKDLGEVKLGEEWLDYRARGLGPAHVPDLMRMLLDPDLNEGDPESEEVWAPLHALRALGQLRAAEATEAILQELQQDHERGGDWVSETAPKVYGMIGPAAVPSLMKALRDGRHTIHLRWVVADSLTKIAQ